MSPRDPRMRRQRQLLQAIHELGLMTDESLGALMGVDRTTLVRWRAGERTAPVDVLLRILAHVEPGEVGEVLDVLAQPYGWRAVRDQAVDAGGETLTGAALDVAGVAGQVVAEVRSALADGELDQDERQTIAAAAAALRREAAQLEHLMSSPELRAVR